LQPLQRQGSQAQTPPDMKIKAIIQAIVTHPMAGRATLGVSRSQKLQWDLLPTTAILVIVAYFFCYTTTIVGGGGGGGG